MSPNLVGRVRPDDAVKQTLLRSIFGIVRRRFGVPSRLRRGVRCAGSCCSLLQPCPLAGIADGQCLRPEDLQALRLASAELAAAGSFYQIWPTTKPAPQWATTLEQHMEVSGEDALHACWLRSLKTARGAAPSSAAVA